MNTTATHPHDHNVGGGRIVTLLGTDAAGKDTVATALCTRIEQLGGKAENMARRTYLLDQPAGHAADLNRTLYDGALRAFYSGALTHNGTELAAEMPSTGDLRDRTLEQRLAGSEITRNDPRTMLTSAVTEIAGAMAYWQTVLHPRAAETGNVLVDSCHLIRSVIKTCAIVQHHCGPGSLLHRQAEQTMDTAATLLRPTSGLVVPVVLRVRPEVAYERRTAQFGRLGPLEHYGAVGGYATREAFLDLQHRVQRELDERVCADWRCVVVDMNGDVSWPAAVDQILADGRMRP
ncbi:hypothetical protein [Kitasatospora sp. NPDC056184]|uniref:hypothetical protein n=1 Tax=Kitasatospora sp. NPDC056184 TaxID=3345738 RepID=UPI0035E34FE8